MYQPAIFREERREVLHELMRAHPFATLVTFGADGLTANHLPMILHADEGEMGVLRCHVARANPVWHDFDAAAGGLAVFQGPHHYVTPSWYPSKAAHGRVVPTWNYAVVQAHGSLTAVEDTDRLRAHVTALTAQQEGGRAAPWVIDDAPADFVARQLKGIVGLELRIARLDGKWKMSQNRDDADRAGVVAGLDVEATDAARQVGRLISD